MNAAPLTPARLGRQVEPRRTSRRQDVDLIPQQDKKLVRKAFPIAPKLVVTEIQTAEDELRAHTRADVEALAHLHAQMDVHGRITIPGNSEHKQQAYDIRSFPKKPKTAVRVNGSNEARTN